MIFSPIERSLAKKAAGDTAAALIENGMKIGIGTGSTTFFFIQALAKRCQLGLHISAVASSIHSEKLATSLGIPLEDPQKIQQLDVTVDGADEIDPHHQMIKGGGGALLREKLLAQASREMWVIADESKRVLQLGAHPLPVEIVPFAYLTTIERLERMGYRGALRLQSDGSPFLTDGGHYLFDIHFPEYVKEPAIIQENIKRVTGVVETGFFLNIAKKIIIGKSHSGVEIEECRYV